MYCSYFPRIIPCSLAGGGHDNPEDRAPLRLAGGWLPGEVRHLEYCEPRGEVWLQAGQLQAWIFFKTHLEIIQPGKRGYLKISWVGIWKKNEKPSTNSKNIIKNIIKSLTIPEKYYLSLKNLSPEVFRHFTKCWGVQYSGTPCTLISKSQNVLQGGPFYWLHRNLAKSRLILDTPDFSKCWNIFKGTVPTLKEIRSIED